MKKNNIFLTALGISAALHVFALIGIAGNGVHAQPPLLKRQFVSTRAMIKVGTAPVQKAAAKQPEKKPVEKSLEPLPDPLPAHGGEARESGETQEKGAAANNETAREDAAGDGGTINSEYEELLAYIKDFINKNLTYPPIARQRNIHGVVGVYLEIGENGGLVSVAVNQSSGSSILDNAAVSLVKKIRPVQNGTITRKIALNVNIDYKITE